MKNEKTNCVTAHEPFISLVKVIREDPQIQAQIIPLLKLDAFHRKSAIHTWLEQLTYQHAPVNFRRALSSLPDDGVAEKLPEIIGE